MDIELLPRQVAELSEIGSQTGRGTDDLVREAVDQLLCEREWLRREAQVGIDPVDRGEFLEEEEMATRVERMLRR
jgi:predicted transcriptional regulator